MAVSDSQLAFMRREEAGKFMDDYELFKLNMLQAYRKRTERADRLVERYAEEHGLDDKPKSGLSSESMADTVKKGRVTRAKRRRASVVELVSGIIGTRPLRWLQFLCPLC